MKKNDCLQTPDYVWRSLGKIDLDPCAGLDTSIGCHNYRLSDEVSGLSRPWFGFVFCNPPFSQKEQWARKMVQHGRGILLLPERGSAPWFGPLALSAGAYWVMGKKINFVGGPSSNNLGSVMFLFGEDAIDRVIKSKLPGHLVEVKHLQPRK